MSTYSCVCESSFQTKKSLPSACVSDESLFIGVFGSSFQLPDHLRRSHQRLCLLYSLILLLHSLATSLDKKLGCESNQKAVKWHQMRLR